jgi:retinol dehydrogenase 12
MEVATGGLASAAPAELAGRAFMVTGGNTGIGRATVAGLARRGGRVYVACRSQEKGRRAVADIVAATGNDAVAFLPLDLADLASVRRCAGEFLALGEPLHVLINNAGVAGQRGITRDGFEMAFGVNHLGHFALTTVLLDRLASSAPARVVTVASDSHYQASGVDFGVVRRPTARTWPAPCGSTARPGSRPDPRTAAAALSGHRRIRLTSRYGGAGAHGHH